jgi:hypothetical protein
LAGAGPAHRANGPFQSTPGAGVHQQRHPSGIRLAHEIAVAAPGGAWTTEPIALFDFTARARVEYDLTWQRGIDNQGFPFQVPY